MDFMVKTPLLRFLIQLGTNLDNSMKAFQTLDKNQLHNLEELSDLINNNNTKLYNYLECLKQLEKLYLLTNNTHDSEQFIYSFNLNANQYNKNFKRKFKEDLAIKVNIHKLKTKKQQPLPPLETKVITSVEGVNLALNPLKLPVIRDLKELPSMFYWYNGDSSNKAGVYTCLSPGFYSRVPFPDIISTTNQNYKLNSIPCKYVTKEICMANKKKISEIHNSEIRTCTYVHRKEKFSKIGAYYRCSIESLGVHQTFAQDLSFTQITDIKRLLMYSLSDSLITTIWYQNKFKDGALTLHDIEYY